MANSSSSRAGSKFSSVNFNQSYGRPRSGSGYSGVGGGSRFASAGHNGGGGGGGMVVLSRPRSGGVKAGQRLSVPPPLNLPSLRKEHEKFDSVAGGAGGAGHGGVGSGNLSGGMGWTKPGFLERENDGGIGQGVQPSPLAARVDNSLPMMSSAAGKAVILRGEDFPSLQAALPSSNGSAHKPKDGVKVKTGVSDLSSSMEDRIDKSSLLQLRSHIPSPSIASDNRLREKVGVDSGFSNDLNASDPTRKQDELFLGPLPIVQLPHRSDWADDERDTSIGTLDKSIELKGVRMDGDFDISKTRYSNTHRHNFSKMQGKIDDENRKVMFQVNSFGFDVRVSRGENQDVNSWRSSIPKDRNISNEMMERGGSSLRSPDLSKDNYASRWADNGLGRTYFDNSNRSRNDLFQKSPVSTASFSMGSKGVTMKDPLLNFAKEKRSKPYVEEPFGSLDFEKRDFFQGSFMTKKKKDAQKQLEFHDPVRESFEAELERVQQIQERERKRVAEEQARALELARKEEEERQRLARVEEDRRKRVEEEARESAWREEHERLEALRRVEEQRTAREEEKKMILLEEERRKEAAKQKLLELEAKIARRQLESLPDSKTFKRDVERMLDVGEWEDGERMVERITSSTSETYGVDRPYESGSQKYNSGGGNVNFIDEGKYVSSRKRDVGGGNSSNFSAYDIKNNFHDSRSESLGREKVLQRKEYLSAGGIMPSRKTGTPNIETIEYSKLRDQSWNPLYETDHLGRPTDVDSEFNEIQLDRFGDIGWGYGRSRNMPHSPKAERLYHNTEADGFSSFSRPRHSMRQPRVPLPPSSTSIHKSLRRNNDTLTFFNDDRRTSASVQNEMEDLSALDKGYMDERQDQILRTTSTNDRSGLPLHSSGNISFRCDSQSSRSVSSPPDSQNLLSDDEIDIFVESSAVDEIQTAAIMDGQLTSVFEGGSNKLMTISNVASLEEDEEWPIKNGQDLQLHEEYDDGDEYKRVDDVHEDEDENFGLSHECEGIKSEDPSESGKTDHLILGFDEGVEVKLLSGDEYEKSTSSIEKTPQLQQGLSSLDNTLMMDCQSGGGAIHVSGGTLETSAELLDETEKSLQQLLITSTGTSESLEVPVRKFHHSSPPTVASPSTVRPPFASAMPSSFESDSSHVQLQFGLFSGPSLFSSPIPAIQIGSIQMPLSMQQLQHSDSPSYFQFGQLKYTSISQGVLPSPTQPMSLMHPANRAQYPLNQVNEGKLGNQALQGYFVHNGDLLGNQSLDMNCSSSSAGADSFEKMHKETNIPMTIENSKTTFPSSHGSAGVSLVNDEIQQKMSARNDSNFDNNQGLEGQQSPFLSSGKKNGGSNYGKGKRFVYNVKSSGSLLPSPSDDLRLDSSGSLGRSRRNYRAEFRMRENRDKKQLKSFVSSSSTGLVGRSDNNVKEFEGVKPIANVNEKDVFCGKPISLGSDSSLVSTKMQNDDQDYNVNNAINRETSSLQQFSFEGEAFTDNGASEDIDSSIQSGTVQVYEQSDIKALSDDDDFIEVKSKKQMLNERREQREKEIKLKSRLAKAPRKPYATPQIVGSFSSGNRNSCSVNNVVAAGKGSGLHMKAAEAPRHTIVPVVTGTVAPPLPPIGTPYAHKDGKSEKGCFKSMSKLAGPTATLVDASPRLPFDSKKVVLDKVATPLVPWANPSINQQFMGFSQTHRDEVIKPTKVMAEVSCMGDQSFLSGSVPLNSMLSGENIQFGAVSSPLVLSSSSCLSNGVRSTVSARTDISINKNMHDSSSALFFEKREHADELSLSLDDEETEAEAAASAVAVAAITNDDVVSNQPSLSDSNVKNYGMTKLEALPDERTNSSLNHQKSEQSLSVHLPADLSVETPSLSLWPPLPSPQSNSNALMTLPFYEMNPMLGRPIYAFGPQDESTNNQLKSHKNSSATTGPVGAWQQCHSGVDSFYGPPNGFAGPFISGPGGIPGMQVPPHMVVYNHFAPVGQFGQVGLSYMGTTYVPSSKQPDWKHIPISSGVTPSENDGNKNDTASDQRTPLNMSGSVQHLAPDSPLLPLPPPLAWFDISPFQSTPDILMSARWPQAIGAHIQPIPSSMSLNQEVDGSMPQQFNPSFLVDPTSGKKPQESQTSNPVDGKVKLHTPSDSSLFQEDLGMSSSKSNITATIFSSGSRPASQSSVNDLGSRVESSNYIDNKDNKTTASSVSSCTSSSVSQNVAFSVKAATPSHQQPYSVGYSGQRANVSAQVNSGNEWRRRVGYQGRNQNVGTGKSFSGPSKVKQIYVAKRSIDAGSTSSG